MNKNNLLENNECNFNMNVTKKTTLVCKGNGAPKPTYKFFKDGSEITSQTPGYKKKGKRLTVLNAKFPEQDGVYSCNVTNMLGSASASTRLLVIGE